MRALFLIALLGGCALFPLEESDCTGMTWERRGYDDGFGGHPPQYMRLASECPRFGVEVSEGDYFKGWQDGRFEYERLTSPMRRRGG